MFVTGRPARRGCWWPEALHGRPEYLLANASSQTKERFSGLEAVCDPVTFLHLQGVGIIEGRFCLEVGAGAGSVAR